MERPRALSLRTCLLTLGTAAALLAGCSPELEKLPRQRSARDSLGQEIYKVLCRRVAATEQPQDVAGRESEALCLGDPETAAQALETQRASLPPRLRALAEQRQRIADALDETLTEDQADDLEQLMRRLLPFYDPPEERMQQSTRALAAVLSRMAGDDAALQGFARWTREGMAPPVGGLGPLRSAFGSPELVGMLGALLKPLTQDAELARSFRAALDGLALELATAELEDAPDSDTCRMRDLLTRSEPASGPEQHFMTGQPLFTVARDVRGMPVPARATPEVGPDLGSACGTRALPPSALPFPFVDEDGDGFADIEGPRFRLDPRYDGHLPAPFPAPGEPESARDEHGRAYALREDGQSDSSAPLYVTYDADGTVLAAAVRESLHLFEGESAALTNLAGAVPALLGDERASERTYGAKAFAYQATDPDKSPLVALMHAAGVLMQDSAHDRSIELTLRLLREQEPALVQALEPLLKLEQRTRPGADAYETAKLEPDNTLWDELLFELEKLSRQRKTADGESTLLAVARSMLGRGRNFSKGLNPAPYEQLIAPELLARQGALLATMLRFKDEWRANPTGRSKRMPGDVGIIGGFRVPVDRSQPDAPITCGKDGCAGPIVGSPFERWRKPNQSCIIQRAGRPAGSQDCGQPSNQSLFQRSMGLLAEMDGRTQCNRPITVADLFDFATADDPEQDASERARTIRDAEVALANDYTCPDDPGAPCRVYADKYPAAFPDADGAGPAKPTIQACALLDVGDVGRTFGKVLTHEYQLTIPNEWVRRYLEDVAKAADPARPDCPDDLVIDNPSQDPGCITEAASLSRGVFKELTKCSPDEDDCVDTLGELIEFLLDDDTLFRNQRDLDELRPDARALSRVMFAPAGSTSTFELFEPLLVRGAPASCASAPGVPQCRDDPEEPGQACCIADLMKPPLRYRLDTYYGSTTFAWEHAFKLSDGSELTFLDAMAPIADAFNRLDEPDGINPAREDKRYGLTVLGTVVASHFDSPLNPMAQNQNPNAPGYRKLTGLVRYEELIADLLDDGSVDRSQLGPSGEALFDSAHAPGSDQQLGLLTHSVPLLKALDQLQFHGEDGLTAMVRTAETWLNPHAYCAGEGGDARVLSGRGACHQNPQRAPVAARDGRDYKCWNDGTCFDGQAGRDKRFVSALDLVLDAAGDMRERSQANETLHAHTRGLLSALLDGFVRTEGGLLAHRRTRALALLLGDYARERWAEERDAGGLSTWNARLVDDLVDAVTNPAVAGALRTLHGLSAQPDALPALSRFMASMVDEQNNPVLARALISWAADLVQSMPGDAQANALVKALASAAAANVDEFLAGRQESLASQQSLLFSNAFVLGEAASSDGKRILGTVLSNATRARSELAERPGAAPLSTLSDALFDVNRVEPGADGPHDAADYKAAFTRMAEVLTDGRRGFERLYRIVQCASSQSGSPSCE